MTNKKAQEEMVGFVMIVLLVSVIFLVFLGIYLRQEFSSEGIQNTEISQFLDALTEVTTNCTIAGTKRTVKDLFTKDQGLPCEGTGKTINETLRVTIEEAIEESWNFGDDSPTQGYEFVSPSFSAPLISIDCSLTKAIRSKKAITEYITIELTICRN